MVYEKVINRLNRYGREFNFKIRKLQKKYRILTLENITVGTLFIVFIFLISGGLASIYTGATQQIIAKRFNSSQTVVELVIYFTIHLSYAISLYLIYSGVKRSRIDATLLTIGILLLLILFITEWYIITVIRQVPI